MDALFNINVPHAVMNCMLFTMVIMATVDEPAAVPSVFQRIWRHYRNFQAIRRIQASQKKGKMFWEIDMTEFEP